MSNGREESTAPPAPASSPADGYKFVDANGRIARGGSSLGLVGVHVLQLTRLNEQPLKQWPVRRAFSVERLLAPGSYLVEFYDPQSGKPGRLGVVDYATIVDGLMLSRADTFFAEIERRRRFEPPANTRLEADDQDDGGPE